MAKLQGIVIADPSKKNLNFSAVEHDNYDVLRKQSGRPLEKFVSEQDKLNNFERKMPSTRQVQTANESTVPITNSLNKEMIDEWRVRRDNLLSDVEKPQLEADKNFSDYYINAGAWFDPKGNYPVSTFKKVERPVLRTVRDPNRKFSEANNYSREVNFVYKNRNYSPSYYSNNPWRDSSTGRVHLYEKPFTRIYA